VRLDFIEVILVKHTVNVATCCLGEGREELFYVTRACYRQFNMYISALYFFKIYIADSQHPS